MLQNAVNAGALGCSMQKTSQIAAKSQCFVAIIQLDAGYLESKEDSLINEMFERIAEMSSVRSIETKCSIHM